MSWKHAGAALTLGLSLVSPALAIDQQIVSKRVTTDSTAILNVNHPAWKKARPFEATMMPQNITTPMATKPAVNKMTVRSLNGENGWIAFLLEWKDGTQDNQPVTNKFADAVAIELPLDSKNLPVPMMGHAPGGRVNIIQWRADWQHDVDHGALTIKDIYPNAVVDVPVEKVYKGMDKVLFSPGRAIGNIVSQEKKPRAVQDLMAEGFGTLTAKQSQSANGRGVYRNKSWHVVIMRPLEAIGDANAAVLSRSQLNQMGFAAWNGSASERGARKSWAAWIPLKIE